MKPRFFNFLASIISIFGVATATGSSDVPNFGLSESRPSFEEADTACSMEMKGASIAAISSSSDLDFAKDLLVRSSGDQTCVWSASYDSATRSMVPGALCYNGDVSQPKVTWGPVELQDQHMHVLCRKAQAITQRNMLAASSGNIMMYNVTKRVDMNVRFGSGDLPTGQQLAEVMVVLTSVFFNSLYDTSSGLNFFSGVQMEDANLFGNSGTLRNGTLSMYFLIDPSVFPFDDADQLVAAVSQRADAAIVQMKNAVESADYSSNQPDGIPQRITELALQNSGNSNWGPNVAGITADLQNPYDGALITRVGSVVAVALLLVLAALS